MRIVSARRELSTTLLEYRSTVPTKNSKPTENQYKNNARKPSTTASPSVRYGAGRVSTRQARRYTGPGGIFLT